jgi:addiction module HigA family antidote
MHKIMDVPKIPPGEHEKPVSQLRQQRPLYSIAQKLGVSRQTVNELLLERRAVSPSMALRLSKLFGNTPEFWLNAQRAVDLWNAERENKQEIERVKPLQAA